MKLLIAVFAAVTLLSAADSPARKKASTVPAAKVAQPPQIPPGAVESEPGTFRYTDARGKKWIYRKTPFGIARIADAPADPATISPRDRGDDVKATEDGDTVRFERPSPFGVYRWQKSKSELTEMEQAVWNRARSSAGRD